MSKNKIQSMIVEHLMKHGHIQLLLPDNMTLEIGITQENNSAVLSKRTITAGLWHPAMTGQLALTHSILDFALPMIMAP